MIDNPDSKEGRRRNESGPGNNLAPIVRDTCIGRDPVNHRKTLCWTRSSIAEIYVTSQHIK
jgi:hypothetical protein